MTTGAVLVDLCDRVLHVAAGPPSEYAYYAFAMDAD